MKSQTKILLLSSLILTLFISAGISSSTIATHGSAMQNAASGATSLGGIRHVVLIMMENHEYNSIIGSSSAPYLNKLANTYALATSYYAKFHPSLPNYLALTGGSNFGITSDCTPSTKCSTTGSSIFSLVSNAGLTWKTYAEEMPQNCALSDYGTSSNKYMVHHNPGAYYTSVRSQCDSNDVPMGSLNSGNLYKDVKSGNLPNLAIIIPDVCNDMHSCSVSTGDKYLSQLIPLLQSSPEYSSTVILVTWDEGSTTDTSYGGGHVAMIVVGPSTLVKYGKFSTTYTHYSTLATIEDIFRLGNLGRGDATATPMTAIIPSA